MSNKISISKREVDKIKYQEAGQNIWYDKKLPGFFIRAHKTCLSYGVQTRVNGKAIRRLIGKHGHYTPDSARIEAQELLAIMAKNKDPKKIKAEALIKNITLPELLAKYESKRQLRPKTASTYKDVVNRLLCDWQSKPFHSISREMVEKRLEEICDNNGESVAGQVHKVMRLLSRFTKEELNLAIEDPTRSLSRKRRWTKNTRRQSCIKRHQLQAWFAAVEALPNKTVKDYLIFCLLTGLRKNEALSIRFADIDFDGALLRIPPEKTKNEKEHLIPIGSYLLSIFQKRLDKIQLSNPYVFPGKNPGTHFIEPKRQVQKVKVKFMIHDLRRTFITIAESLDIPPYSLKRLLNHSQKSNDVTSGYIVTDLERLRLPMQKIEDYILVQAGIKNETVIAAVNQV